MENLTIVLIFIFFFHFVSKEILENAKNKQIEKPTNSVRYVASAVIASLATFVIYICIFYS